MGVGISTTSIQRWSIQNRMTISLKPEVLFKVVFLLFFYPMPGSCQKDLGFRVQGLGFRVKFRVLKGLLGRT